MCRAQPFSHLFVVHPLCCGFTNSTIPTCNYKFFVGKWMALNEWCFFSVIPLISGFFSSPFILWYRYCVGFKVYRILWISDQQIKSVEFVFCPFFRTICKLYVPNIKKWWRDRQSMSKMMEKKCVLYSLHSRRVLNVISIEWNIEKHVAFYRKLRLSQGNNVSSRSSINRDMSLCKISRDDEQTVAMATTTMTNE